MDAGQPTTTNLREHYGHLARSRGLDVAMCWTVVIPHNAKPLNLQQIATRLGGDTPGRLHPPAPLSALVPFASDAYPVLIDQHGSTIALWEYDYLGATPAVLRRLSHGARVYSAWWNVNAHNQLSFAADGELILQIDALFPGRPEDHPGIDRWPQLEAMQDFFVDFEERDDDYDWRAAWLALIDQTTGAKLTSAWFDQTHPYVMVHVPDAIR
ncbi:DUF6461 domain-containing protein [Nonomuraea sp. NPDC049141]|uniref:DUF6461 domain-containing protein n=1 Tax=Nonomuraea sp. NPDC049141 TaxID=3155500 RepID=UPI0033E550C9